MKYSSNTFLVRAVLVLSVFLLTQTAYAQIQTTGPGSIDAGLGGSNTIVGTVYSPDGQRIERRMRIKLVTETRGDITSMTDERGNFAFRGVAGGNYNVLIDGEKEFEPVSQQVNIIQLRGSPGGTYTLNIRLVLKKSAATSTGVVGTAFANVPPRALEFYKKGTEMAKAGDRKGAIEQLQQAIDAHPKFMLAFNDLGVIYLKMNQLDKADEALRSALNIEPEAFVPLLNRGIVLVSAKRWEEAIPILRSALKARSSSPPAHYFLGQALANHGDFAEAEKELSTAIKTGGAEMKEAHRIMAILLSARGEKKRAAEELETYLKLAPNAPDAEQLRNTIRNLRGEIPVTPAKSN